MSTINSIDFTAHPNTSAANFPTVTGMTLAVGSGAASIDASGRVLFSTTGWYTDNIVPSSADYTISLVFYFTGTAGSTSESLLILARYTSTDSVYRAIVSLASGVWYIKLYKGTGVVPGGSVAIPGGLSTGAHTLKCEVAAGNISVYLDGTKHIDYTDSSALTAATVALGHSGLSTSANGCLPTSWLVESTVTVGIDDPATPEPYLRYKGYPRSITGTATGLAAVKLELTRDASAGTPTWETVSASVPVSAGIWSYEYTPTGDDSTDCQFRVSDPADVATNAVSATLEIAALGLTCKPSANYRRVFNGEAFAGAKNIDVCAFHVAGGGANGDGIDHVAISINGGAATNVTSRTAFATLGPFTLYCYRLAIDAADYSPGPVTVDVTVVPMAGVDRVLPQLTLIANADGSYTGGTVYVDPSAAPGGDGSSGAPYQTLAAALNVVESGGTVILAAEDDYDVAGLNNATPAAASTPNYVVIRPTVSLNRDNVRIVCSSAKHTIYPRIKYLDFVGLTIDLKNLWKISRTGVTKILAHNCKFTDSYAPSESDAAAAWNASPIAVVDDVVSCDLVNTYHALSSLKSSEDVDVSGTYYDVGYNAECAINTRVSGVSKVRGDRYIPTGTGTNTTAVHAVNGTIFDGAETVFSAEWPTDGPWTSADGKIVMADDPAGSRYTITITDPVSGDKLIYASTSYNATPIGATYTLSDAESDAASFTIVPDGLETAGPHLDLNQQYTDGSTTADNILVYGMTADPTVVDTQGLFVQGAISDSAYVAMALQIPASDAQSQIGYGTKITSGLLLQDLRWTNQSLNFRSSDYVAGTHRDIALRDCHLSPSSYITYVTNAAYPQDVAASGLLQWSDATSDVPAAPTDLTTTAAGSTTINLGWTDNASNETGFDIYRSEDGETFAKLASAAADATTYADTTCEAGTQYYYYVVATNAAGDSAASNTASATTEASASPPAAPSDLTATAISATEVDLSWVDNADDETGFVLEIATDEAFTQNLRTLNLPANGS